MKTVSLELAKSLAGLSDAKSPADALARLCLWVKEEDPDHDCHAEGGQSGCTHPSHKDELLQDEQCGEE